jgi:hypothetical protein
MGREEEGKGSISRGTKGDDLVILFRAMSLGQGMG